MISKTSNIVAFGGRSRLVRCEPTRALRRDFGTASRARYARFMFTAGLLAAHFEGHVAAAEKIYKVVEEEGNVTFTDTPPTTLTPSLSRILSSARTPTQLSRQHLKTSSKQTNLMLNLPASPESFLGQINPPYPWARVTLWSGQRSHLISTVRNSSTSCSMAQRSAPHSQSLDGNSPTFFVGPTDCRSCASGRRERRRANPLSMRIMSCDPR